MVVIEAEHMCMVMRGIKKIGTKTITSSMSGVFTENDALRAETMSLLRG
jgi:GTP cyclohydrolase I